MALKLVRLSSSRVRARAGSDSARNEVMGSSRQDFYEGEVVEGVVMVEKGVRS